MVKVKFKDLITNNEADLKNEMQWNNYNLNDTEMEVQEILKTHAISTLKREFGKYYVDEDILDEVKSEIFMCFPQLMQQLSISRTVTGRAVVPVDTLREIVSRNESRTQSNSGSSSVTLGTRITENTSNTGESTNSNQVSELSSATGESNVSDITNSTTDIVNSSEVEISGGKQINVNYGIPQQAIGGVSNEFPVDSEGTPDLSDATINGASGSFTTSNPVTNGETSNQNQVLEHETTNSSTTSNNSTINETATTNEESTGSRNVSNSGTDISSNNESTTEEHDYREEIEREATNAQYSYEISNFLTSSETHNSFKIWVGNFHWVIGIL